jgi:putative acetyltransferase
MVGHIAFSPVTIDSELKDWYGLGPISVLPDYQRQGVGSALIHDGLLKIRDLGAKGCVLLGDPAYYRRFGFLPHPDLVLAGVSPEYFQTISFGNETSRGKVEYHQAFSVCDS